MTTALKEQDPPEQTETPGGAAAESMDVGFWGKLGDGLNSFSEGCPTFLTRLLWVQQRAPGSQVSATSACATSSRRTRSTQNSLLARINAFEPRWRRCPNDETARRSPPSSGSAWPRGPRWRNCCPGVLPPAGNRGGASRTCATSTCRCSAASSSTQGKNRRDDDRRRQDAGGHPCRPTSTA